MEDIKPDWHLDRKVTIGIITALLFNAGSSIWWASKLDFMVQSHELRIKDNNINIKELGSKYYVINQKLTRIETYQEIQTQTLKEIKSTLRKK